MNLHTYLASILARDLHPSARTPLGIMSDNGYYVNFRLSLPWIAKPQNTPALNHRIVRQWKLVERTSHENRGRICSKEFSRHSRENGNQGEGQVEETHGVLPSAEIARSRRKATWAISRSPERTASAGRLLRVARNFND